MVDKRLKRWEYGWLKIEAMRRWLIEEMRRMLIED